MSRADRRPAQRRRGNALTRRGFLGLCGAAAWLLALPRRAWSRASDALGALRRILGQRRAGARPKMADLAAELERLYGIRSQPISVRAAKGTVLEALRLDSGSIYADGNGDGALAIIDIDFRGAFDDIPQQPGLTPGTVETIAGEMRAAMPSLADQASYPLGETARLFAAAAGEEGAGRVAVQRQLDTFLSYLRQERQLRDRLEDLQFFARDERAIQQAAAEQARILDSVRDLRQQRVLPLLRQVATAAAAARPGGAAGA